MGLQVYYVVISIYGWMLWNRKSELSGEKSNLNISHISIIQTLWLIVVFIILSGVIHWILKKHTDSDVPFWDAITTAGGFVATWMLARKYIEHWLFWVLLNTISIGLYIYKGLYPTTILFAIYTIMALVGYRTWRKLLNDQSI